MHILCPHCHNPIELVKLTPREEIACPSCGSSFRLETDETAAWNPERKKLGRFELREVLGSGGFGSVYRAHDPELDRLVAVKVPRAGNLAGPEELDRFLREARSVAQLRHPAIVSVHEVGQADGVAYLVSELVQGVTLADRLSAKPFSFREAAELIAVVAEALHHAHEHGVIHRDVKPSNIMLEHPQISQIPQIGGRESDQSAKSVKPADVGLRPRLMDFGLAKRDAGEITMTIEGQVLGTPAYMAPEQARGDAHRVDGRSDVYSLGVILYQLLTGELPFRGTQRMLLHQVLHDEPRQPRSLNDRIPRDLETVCLKAMSKEPARRYATARDLADDLRRFLKREPILARPVSRSERALKWVKRNPVVAALIALVVLSVLGGTSGIMLKYRDARDAEAAAVKAEGEVRVERDDARRARDELRDTLYAADLNLIQAAWETDNTNRVLELLDRQIPKDNETDLRGFEWHYWRRQCNSDLRTMKLHQSRNPTPFGVAVLSGDASRCCIMTSAPNNELVLRVCDTAAGKEIITIPGRMRGAFWRPSLNRDGTVLIGIEIPSGIFLPGEDRKPSLIHVWDTQRGNALSTITVPSVDHSRLYPVALSGDGTRFAVVEFIPREAKESTKPGLRSADDPTQVKVVDSRTGKEVALLAVDVHVESLSLNSDGSRLAALVQELDPRTKAPKTPRVQIWDVRSRQVVVSFEATSSLVGVFGGGSSGSFSGSSMSFSPDDARLALVAHEPGFAQSVRLWDVETGKLLRSLTGTFRQMGPVRFSPDGKMLAGFGRLVIGLWDAETGRLRQTYKGHTNSVVDVAFTPDGRQVLSVDVDGVAKVWDTAFLNEPAPSRISPSFGIGMLSADGSRIILPPVSSFGPGAPRKSEIKLLDVGGKQLRSFPVAGFTGGGGSRGSRIVCNRDASRLAAVDYSDGGDPRNPRKQVGLRAWETSSGRELFTIPADDQAQVGNLAVSADGTRLAATYYLIDKDNSFGALFFGKDGGLRVFDFATGKELSRFEPRPATRWLDVVLSPDGTRVAATALPIIGGRGPNAADQEGLYIWDVATRQELLHLKTIANKLLFSPDGKWLAGVSGARFSQGGGIRLWNTADGREVATFKGHTNQSEGIAFSSDGRRLVSVSGGFDDANIELKIWDTVSGRELLSLRGRPGQISSIAFGANDQRLIAAGSFADRPSDLVQIWDATPLPAERNAR